MSKVPEPIRKVFEKFPLQTNEPAPVGNEGEGGSESGNEKPTLYVYNCESNTALDPACLQAQCLVKMSGEDIKICTGSAQISQSNSLPYLLEKDDEGKTQVYSTIRAIVTRLAPEHVQSEVYQSLIETALGDAWCCELLQEEEVRKRVYLVEQGMPGVVQTQQASQISQQLLKRLEPRYPAFVKQHESYKSLVIKPPPIEQQVLDQAEECIQTFDNMLVKSPFLSGDKPGVLDALLVAYVYPIKTLIPDSKLGKLLTDRLVQHSTVVCDVLL